MESIMFFMLAGIALLQWIILRSLTQLHDSLDRYLLKQLANQGEPAVKPTQPFPPWPRRPDEAPPESEPVRLAEPNAEEMYDE